MNKAKQLYDALRKISISGADLIPGVVVEINNDVIDVEVDGIIYYDVQLLSVTDSTDGIFVIPKINSTVLIQRIGDAASSNYVTCMYSEVDTIKKKTGNTIYQQNNEGFLFQKGNDSLEKILSDLISEIRLIYAPMNHSAHIAIQQRIKQLLK